MTALFARVLVVYGLLALVQGIDNGQGLAPAMGYSSWNDCASEIHEQRVKAIADGLIKTGLAAKGYVHVNVDEGWLLGRNATTNEIIEDPEKFPSGMKALGEHIHSLEVPGKGKIMKYGLYTCRGSGQCGTQQYQAVGSLGHEKGDAQWMVDAGMDYLKEDSCTATQDHTEAFAQYALMRDMLNGTGRSVYFSLCGWNTWYAPVGKTLGNSWRIGGDGTNWGALTDRLNDMAQLGKYAAPGGWNDPDLLLGTGIGSSDDAREGDGKHHPDNCWKGGSSTIPQSSDWYMENNNQSRAQFTMWCITSAPLLISANINSVDAYALETWGNEEAIYVNQHFREGGPYQGERIVGGDLSYSLKTPTSPAKGSGTNVWAKPLPDGEFALAMISNEDTPQDVTCDAACFAKAGATNKAGYKVRDLWAHADVGAWTAGSSFTAKGLIPHGGVALYRFTPV
eukprot:g1575.t1